jgi:hypothetical protein
MAPLSSWVLMFAFGCSRRGEKKGIDDSWILQCHFSFFWGEKINLLQDVDHRYHFVFI